MAITTYSNATENKHWWWLTNHKVVEKKIKDARTLIATKESSKIVLALSLLDEALAISPHSDQALELRAKSLLCLRRFKDVANMLKDCFTNLKMAHDSASDSFVSDQSLFERFSNMIKHAMTGLKSGGNEGYWRYLALGQACFHLGLLDDATILLQTGKNLARAAFRRKSASWSDDLFSESNTLFSDNAISRPPTTRPSLTPQAQFETANQLLAKIKSRLCQRTTAIAALDAGFYSEAIELFSKIVDGCRAPQAFLAECYLHRALAFQSAGRIVDSIADYNRTLSLDPNCFHALEARASILETIHCYQDCRKDLENMKRLYIAILSHRKLSYPVRKPHKVRYNEIPEKVRAITVKIELLKQKMANAAMSNVDYYALIGLPRGCDRSELEKAYRLLSCRHKPETATCFIKRCELADERGVNAVKDRAMMSANLLYKLLEKGYSSVMNTIMEKEADEKRRKMVSQLQQTSANANANANANTNANVDADANAHVHSVVELQESRDELENKFDESSSPITESACK